MKNLFARLFARNPKQPVLPITFGKVDLPLAMPSKLPVIAKETPRKRCAYIPTNESPWGVISYENGRWRIALYYIWETRKEARREAYAYSALHQVPTRVVRAIIPTR